MTTWDDDVTPMPPFDVDDFRARIDVEATYADDLLLAKYGQQATAVVANELDPGSDHSVSPNVAEAVQQIAVKLWDMRPRGVSVVGIDGIPEPAALPATSGLVRAVRGLLIPSMPAGGVTV